MYGQTQLCHNRLVSPNRRIFGRTRGHRQHDRIAPFGNRLLDEPERRYRVMEFPLLNRKRRVEREAKADMGEVAIYLAEGVDVDFEGRWQLEA